MALQVLKRHFNRIAPSHRPSPSPTPTSSLTHSVRWDIKETLPIVEAVRFFCYKNSDINRYRPRKRNTLMNKKTTQKERLFRLLEERTIVRASEFNDAGIAATTVSRAVEDGDVIRIGRGLYQLLDSETGSEQTLAEASKKVPGGTICMVSALAFHGLTDQMPSKIWIAIGARDWKPKVKYPPIRFVRFRDPYLKHGVEFRRIADVEVPVYSIAKSLSDAFRNPKMLDRSVAIECLRNAIRSHKATPSVIAETAKKCGAWKQMRPYLEAIAHDG